MNGTDLVKEAALQYYFIKFLLDLQNVLIFDFHIQLEVFKVINKILVYVEAQLEVVAAVLDLLKPDLLLYKERIFITYFVVLQNNVD